MLQDTPVSFFFIILEKIFGVKVKYMKAKREESGKKTHIYIDASYITVP